MQTTLPSHRIHIWNRRTEAYEWTEEKNIINKDKDKDKEMIGE